MESIETVVTEQNRRPAIDLRPRPLSLLITLIVVGSRAALDEFHNSRVLFRYKGNSYRLVEFLQILRDNEIDRGTNPIIADDTYDLTLAKFSNIPEESHEQKIRFANVDCRKHFRACLNS